MLTDIRRALRNLFRTPGFALIAVATLALGIGATTAMFSAVDAMLLRSLPYPDADRLAMLWVDGEKRGFARQDYTNPADIASWREQSKTVEALGGFTGWSATLTGTGEPRNLRGASVTHGYFDALGVVPAKGRWFRAEEDRQGAPNVAIISHELWQREFGGAESTLGGTVALNGEQWTIVGIMPPGFEAPMMPEREVYRMQRGDPNARGGMFLRVIGRLKPGVSREQAQAEFEGIAAQLASAYPDSNKDLGAYVQPLGEAVAESIRTQLLVLLGATAFVLLIACANLANLLLARAAGRARELAVRAALGGSRARIARQLLTESCVLALAGAAAGIGVAYALVQVIMTGLPEEATAVASIGIDGRVFAFAITSAVMAGLAFGSAPAYATARQNLVSSLREGDRGAAGGRTGARMRRILVVGTFALALALTVGAGLFLKSLARLNGVDPGFEPAGGVSFAVSLPAARYKETELLVQKQSELRQRLANVPGVEAVGFASTIPLSDVVTDTMVSIEGGDAGAEPLRAFFSQATPGYLESMGIAVRSGRALDESQTATSPCQVNVNEAFAREYLAGRDALGARINLAPGEPEPSYCEIVGVVADLRFASMSESQAPSMYLPLARFPSRNVFVTVRAHAGDAADLLPAMRQEIAAFDPAMAIGSVRTLDAVVDDALRGTRLVTALIGGFAGLALLLSAIGVYGVLAHVVTSRRREIGVRMAVGASTGEIVRMVLASGLKLAAAGMAIGLVLSLALGRTLSTLLYEVTPFDPAVFAAVAALLALVAAFATALPALRAARVDPMIALRDE